MARKPKEDKRRKHLKKGDPNAPAAFEEGVAAPLTFDPEKVAEDAGLWWELNGGDNFVICMGGKVWTKMKQAKVTKRIRNLPRHFVALERREKERLSEIDRVYDYVMENRYVHRFMGGLAGYKMGMHEMMGGKKVIVADSPCAVVAKKGSWARLKWIFNGMFNLQLDDRMMEDVESECGFKILDPLAIDQTNYFYAWMKTGRMAFLKGKPGSYKQGHGLVMSGPSNCWKSTLQDTVITPLLGGRQANPMPYLLGKDAYNDDMMQAEHLAMGELPSASQKTVDRVALSENIKTIVANRHHRLRVMRSDPVTVMPFWRLSISLNNDPDKMRSFPMLTNDFKDKIIMLLIAKRPLPMATRTDEEQEAFAEAIREELPAFAWWLENVFEIPEELLVDDEGKDATRFGFRDFQHPTLAQELFDDTPAAKLLRLVDLAEFRKRTSVFDGDDESEGVSFKLWEMLAPANRFDAGSKLRTRPRTAGMHLVEFAGDKGIWENSSEMLETLLLGEDPAWTCSVARDAKNLFRFNECARLLSRLKEDKPDRVYHRHANDGWTWMIARAGD